MANKTEQIQYSDPTKNWERPQTKREFSIPELTADEIKIVEQRIKNWDRKNF